MIEIGFDMAALVDVTRGKNPTQGISAGKRLLSKLDLEVAPLGAGNSKTMVPSTYRPVGDTCPSTCPWLNKGCYAQHGHVSIAAKRAASAALPSVRAAALAMTVARHNKLLARLHVSGDFLEDNVVAAVYVDGLIQVAGQLRELLPGDDALAWSYTHLSQEEFGEDQERLRRAGINVLWSEQRVDGGALVWDFDRAAELRAKHPELRFVKCRAQLQDGVSCASCDLCYQAAKPDAHMTILFDPHGVKERAMRKSLI